MRREGWGGKGALGVKHFLEGGKDPGGKGSAVGREGSVGRGWGWRGRADRSTLDDVMTTVVGERTRIEIKTSAELDRSQLENGGEDQPPGRERRR